MALVTLVLFGGGGALLMAMVQQRDVLASIVGPWHWLLQLLAGLSAGFIIAWAAWRIIRSRSMQPVRARYAGLVAELMPGRLLPVVVSISAGVGEELLFRGAVQHWLGIVPTAILFVAIHGYLDPSDRAMLRYGVFMTLAMCLLGLAADRCGLLLPMTAHAVIDLVLITRLVAAHRAGGA